MKKIVGLKELRENTEDYIQQVKRGAEFIVMRRSEPIFRITSAEEDGWEEMIDFTKLKKGGVDIDAVLNRL